jgi:hypothetical protein
MEIRNRVNTLSPLGLGIFCNWPIQHSNNLAQNAQLGCVIIGAARFDFRIRKRLITFKRPESYPSAKPPNRLGSQLPYIWKKMRLGLVLTYLQQSHTCSSRIECITHSSDTFLSCSLPSMIRISYNPTIDLKIHAACQSPQSI